MLFLAAAPGFAQAWTSPAGQGTAWLSAQTLHTDAHLFSAGQRTRNVEVRANTATLGIDYGLTDRLALGLSVPYVSSRFKGGTPHVGSSVDDYQTHGSLTDLRVELRYKVLDSAVVFTPTVAAIKPLRNYATLGHSAAGRGLNEYSAGFEIGHNAVAISPSLFLSGGYTYSYVERITDDVTVDRSNADLQVAYFLTPRISLRASALWQETHGGLDFPLSPQHAAEHGHQHDQLAGANFWRGAGAVGFALTPTVDLFGSWSTVIEGVNSHAFRSWSAGIAWNFDQSQFRRARPTSVASLPDLEPESFR